MTPPDVWTSAAPNREYWYWIKLDDGNRLIDCSTTLPPAVVRSVLPIPSAERLAAMERAVEALRSLYGLVAGEASRLLDDDRGGSSRLALEVEAALAAVEAAQ